MVLPFTAVVNSEKETAEIAEEFSKILNNGDIVLLNGNLGTGKTFFVKRVCARFGIDYVSSPSYSIVNEYSGFNKIYHFDFYRIKKLQELYGIGFNDYLLNDAVVFIEWAELFQEILPKIFFEIKFEFISTASRKIEIKKHE